MMISDSFESPLVFGSRLGSAGDGGLLQPFAHLSLFARVLERRGAYSVLTESHPLSQYSQGSLAPSGGSLTVRPAPGTP